MDERPQFSLLSTLLLFCGIGLYLAVIRLAPNPLVFYWLPPLVPGVLLAAGLVGTRGKTVKGALYGGLVAGFLFLFCCLLPVASAGREEREGVLIARLASWVVYIASCVAVIGAGLQAQHIGYRRFGRFLTDAGMILFALAGLLALLVFRIVRV